MSSSVVDVEEGLVAELESSLPAVALDMVIEDIDLTGADKFN
jgi:hypothetical protein